MQISWNGRPPRRDPASVAVWAVLSGLMVAGEHVPLAVQAGVATLLFVTWPFFRLRHARRWGLRCKPLTPAGWLWGLVHLVLAALAWLALHRRFPVLDPAYFPTWALGGFLAVEGALVELGRLPADPPNEEPPEAQSDSPAWLPEKPWKAMAVVAVPVALVGGMVLEWLHVTAFATGTAAPTGAFTEALVDRGQTVFVTPETLARIELLDRSLGLGLGWLVGLVVLITGIGIALDVRFWRQLADGLRSHFEDPAPGAGPEA